MLKRKEVRIYDRPNKGSISVTTVNGALKEAIGNPAFPTINYEKDSGEIAPPDLINTLISNMHLTNTIIVRPDLISRKSSLKRK